MCGNISYYQLIALFFKMVALCLWGSTAVNRFEKDTNVDFKDGNDVDSYVTEVKRCK